MNVARIDPRRFSGHLAGSVGPDLYHRETTSPLARAGAATEAVNSGFFVLDRDIGVGDGLPVRPRLGSPGRPLATPPGTTVTNGGPQLVRRGRVEITQRRLVTAPFPWAPAARVAARRSPRRPTPFTGVPP